jgi:V8-like Glu-specific endopeptidase
MPSDGADFAIVKLDRRVRNHLPLTLRSSGDVVIGNDLTVVGYPEGLPLKLAGGAQVRATGAAGFFTANTDTYGGNSGSAVVNTLTHQVEGVLVWGEKDFEWTQKGCARSYRCKADACRGEDITRISEVIKAMDTPLSN